MRHTGILGAIVCFAVLAQAQEIDFRAQVEADWLIQEEYRYGSQPNEITPESDAAGACDGIKDGEWGFHTDLEDAPWWQVDLEAEHAIARVVIWNRCGGVAGRAAHLKLLGSSDGASWQEWYAHDGTVFQGFTDNAPLTVELDGKPARIIRIELPDRNYLHFDEVEVFGTEAEDTNLALHRPALQSSISKWSESHRVMRPVDWAERCTRVLRHTEAFLDELQAERIDVSDARKTFAQLAAREACEEAYLEARWFQRKLTLAHPLLSFDRIFFAKRLPGTFNHMSDQYYGWWSRPGGGLYVLSDFANPEGPSLEWLSASMGQEGSFLRPILSYDATKALFAWCRHYPGLADEPDKLNKDNVPEDAFYHVFEMDLPTQEVRQLTRGKYDDFDARYLPGGDIIFLSTRRGQFVQCGKASAQQTLSNPAMPDAYVRCGGGPERPVAVYTLHRMNADGGDLCAISPFEMFEWTPSIAHDGRILYSRWDYVDRDNMPYMGLWSINPDGTNSSIVYGNFTHEPHCTFEPRSIPNSSKIIFTASGHHAQTMGSLVLLDPSVGTEGKAPVTRLTPEVVFPEIEGWPETYFANPWPLSERFYLVAWGKADSVSQGGRMSGNAMGIYLFDAAGNLELLYRDPNLSCAWPMPLELRRKPLRRPDLPEWGRSNEGRFVVTDIYHGLPNTTRGAVKALRVVAVPAKTHPTMNYPVMGVTRDDPGKCVLGTVPVEDDGSAHFRAPAGVMVFFQALDARGMAIQTMRSSTHVQPGQTLSCVGCHESRTQAPPLTTAAAARREPSKLSTGPEGSWPLRFDRLVQPVLDAHCITCHREGSDVAEAAKRPLASGSSYDMLVAFGKPSLQDHVRGRYREGKSQEGQGAASTSPLLAMLTRPEGHHNVKLSAEDTERLVVWMDTYGQRLGSFDERQERQLVELREQWRDLLAAATDG
ncbi:MAG: discoidin domain-containing protein [Candidatus Hydrogenedentota bacterium]